ncbi:DUF5690 family protein [Flavihumibacter fluvii]|uniref:DUF5690 family protein n=1 Tax=Flavihumibacter fluvii TaxID=2838157 RepID=UPI001BDE6081|nr:DUF5690 family protein [Flavihumibacter fluvii]ULQ52035.1 DUF5690 family protein [Flavihumibacter fluvii]
MLSQSTFTGKITKAQVANISLAAFASFSTYFCMYGFRKTISATTFDGINTLGISFKSALVIAQVLGYMTAKFIGIKFIAELEPAKRARYILLLIGGAHLSLLMLALVPRPLNLAFLYINGMCLGLIWGLVFSFIEGRRFTDFIALILSINFIFSSGVAKSIGRVCIESWGIAEIYMPFVAGCLFLPLLFISVYALTRIPPPTPLETAQRGKREPMNAQGRKALLQRFLPGLLAIILINLLLTILRDIKDNYAVEIIRKIRPDANPGIFTRMETIAALVVFALLLTISGLSSHFKSIKRHHFVIGAGFIAVGLCAICLYIKFGDAIALLVTYTIGLYLSYNTLQCLFLDRFISAYKVNGNIGFFFYLMDSVGYLGSCILILNKELFNTQTDWLPYFIYVSAIFAVIGLATVVFSWIYFRRKFQQLQTI